MNCQQLLRVGWCSTGSEVSLMMNRQVVHERRMAKLNTRSPGPLQQDFDVQALVESNCDTSMDELAHPLVSALGKPTQSQRVSGG